MSETVSPQQIEELKLRLSTFTASAKLFFSIYVTIIISSFLMIGFTVLFLGIAKASLKIPIIQISFYALLLTIITSLFILILIASFVQQSSYQGNNGQMIGNIGLFLAIISIASYLIGITSLIIFYTASYSFF